MAGSNAAEDVFLSRNSRNRVEANAKPVRCITPSADQPRERETGSSFSRRSFLRAKTPRGGFQYLSGVLLAEAYL